MSSRRAIEKECVSREGERGKEGRTPPRTELAGEVDEILVVGDGDNEHLERRDRRRKREDLTGGIGLASPERVLEERVKDTTDTERWLDDVGDKLADRGRRRFQGDGEVGREDLVVLVVEVDSRGSGAEWMSNRKKCVRPELSTLTPSSQGQNGRLRASPGRMSRQMP